MTVYEAKQRMKHERDNDPFVGTAHRQEQHKAMNMAIASLEAWEKIDKQLEALINKPCLNQNMMVQNLAYRNVQEMIKKQLGEMKHDTRN